MADNKDNENVLNQRKLRRHYLIYYLRVFDRENGSVLGHLIDITPEGIMILRDSPIEIGRSYSLRLRWRNSVGRLQIADFDGECRWCHPDVNPDFYGAGFSIASASEEHIKAISDLIDDLSMPERE